MPLNDRKGILSQIRNPLGFFALALLIIEGSLGAVTIGMTSGHKFYTVLIMAFLFLCVVASVVFITIHKPKHLYEQIASSLEATKEIREFMNSKGFADVVHDLTCKKCTNFIKTEQ